MDKKIQITEGLPVFKFEGDLWHPSLSKKYIDSNIFTIVNHEKNAEKSALLDLLQSKSTITHKPEEHFQQEFSFDGLSCQCNFTYADLTLKD